MKKTKTTLGTKLKELREEAELSQEAAATGIGISQSALARYELDKTEPRASELILICRYYDVEPNELLSTSD
jgi:transcriptional regulator with XRE-family HTH domain